ncbi:hypothetical protein L596_023802 [Steinernema carpocapsae]|uniref:F-box domain-containing protein n=1 Tax=Steinernema carpocapsae TaxID=34508 RepID=A0A4U5MER2_STECR|nr:hypothetical protein L596_023802 [Steinernema carpocapsae]
MHKASISWVIREKQQSKTGNGRSNVDFQVSSGEYCDEFRFDNRTTWIQVNSGNSSKTKEKRLMKQKRCRSAPPSGGSRKLFKPVFVHRKPIELFENIESLPNAVLKHIFDFCALDELISLQIVSRRFNDLLRNDFYRARLWIRVVPGARIVVVTFKNSSGKTFHDDYTLRDSLFKNLLRINRDAHVERFVVDSLNLYLKEVNAEILETVCQLAEKNFRLKYLEISYADEDDNKLLEGQFNRLFDLLLTKHLVHFKLRIQPCPALFRRMLKTIDSMQLKKIELIQSSPESQRILFYRCLARSGLFISMPFCQDFVRPIPEQFKHISEAIESWKSSPNPGLYSFLCVTNNRSSSIFREALLVALGIPEDERKDEIWQWTIPHGKKPDFCLRIMNRKPKISRMPNGMQNGSEDLNEAWAFTTYRNHLDQICIKYQQNFGNWIKLPNLWKPTNRPNHYRAVLKLNHETARFEFQLQTEALLFVNGTCTNVSPSALRMSPTLRGAKSKGYADFIDLHENSEVYLIWKVVEREAEDYLLHEDVVRLNSFVFDRAVRIRPPEDFERLISCVRRFDILKEFFMYSCLITFVS